MNLSDAKTELINILFDFGGVILNIDFSLTVEAFRELGIPEFDTVFSKFKQDNFMQDFERGIHPPDAFYAYIKRLANASMSDLQVQHAWNALLLDYPQNRIELLKALSKKYGLFLLSNTNAIHYEAFQKDFTAQFGFAFDTLFTAAFYSHLLGERKPDASCYLKTAKLAGIEPGETLFIDDTEMNIEAAKNLGFQTIHIKKGDEITELLAPLLA